MIKKSAIAIVVSALACATWASSASAKHHHKHTPVAPGVQAMGANAYPAPYASSGVFAPSDVVSPRYHSSDPINGVNPMTNAPPIPAVAKPAPYVKVQGVNPM
jgi:hypothetical protein